MTKSKLTTVKFATVILSLFLFAATALAQGFGGPGRYGGGDFADRFAAILGLSDAQKAQIETIREQAEAASKPYLDQLKPLREQMEALIESSTFNESAFRALAAQASQLQIELQVVQARARSASYNVLTAEQKAKLAELRKAMEERRGGGRPGGGGRRP
jgi:Spy/CpxP family protein refolding chaperone